jgi:hypothetical protein
MIHLTDFTPPPHVDLPMNGKQVREEGPHTLSIAAGTTIVLADRVQNRRYTLLSGEVVILRNGQIVDLIEAGEILDPVFWPGMIAVAWHHSVLQPLA